jgi:nitrate reductase gamma subunit
LGFINLLFWVIYPYVAITVFVVGLVLRFDKDPYGWTSKSSQILERRMLMVGSMLFHWSFIFVFIGHIMGLVIPPSFYLSLGISFSSYHEIAFYGGAVAGVLSVAGLVILLIRRLAVPRVRAIAGIDDYVTLGVLLVVMSSGLLNTLGFSLFVGPYDYRYTLGAWIRSILTLNPNLTIMATTPYTYQLHALLGLLFFAVLPFTRLVHIFSLPLPYLWRKNIVYRSMTKKEAPKVKSQTE